MIISQNLSGGRVKGLSLPPTAITTHLGHEPKKKHLFYILSQPYRLLLLFVAYMLCSHSVPRQLFCSKNVKVVKATLLQSSKIADYDKVLFAPM